MKGAPLSEADWQEARRRAERAEPAPRRTPGEAALMALLAGSGAYSLYLIPRQLGASSALAAAITIAIVTALAYADNRQQWSRHARRVDAEITQARRNAR